MCITIVVGERERKFMGLSMAFLNLVLVFMSLALFCLAIAIRYKLDQKLELLDGYNSGALPYYLMVVATIMFVIHLVGVNFCYNGAYVETRSSTHHVFVTYIFVVIGVFFLVVITEIVIAVHSSKIKDALSDGISKSIKLVVIVMCEGTLLWCLECLKKGVAAYKTDLKNKIKLDKLQLEYECCGADSYKDWFKTPWVNVMFVNVDSREVKPYLRDGDFVKDDAPFSCCSKFSKRACVHHSVQSTVAHRNYEGHTLYNSGCVDVMMDYFSSRLLTPTALMLVWVLIFQTVAVAVMRMLQTSILEAEEMNDPEGPSQAYCLKGVGGSADNRRYLKRKVDKDEKGGKETEDEDDDDDDDESDAGGGSSGGGSSSRGDDDDDNNDDDDDDDRGGGMVAGESRGDTGLGGGGGGGGGSGFGQSGSDSEKDEGSASKHDDDDGDKGGGGKKSKEEKKREKEEKKREKDEKKDANKQDKDDKKKSKEEKKEEKRKKKEEKKGKDDEDKGEKKKKKDKKGKDKETKEDKQHKKNEKKKAKNEKKEEKKKNKKDKKDANKEKKKGKKGKDLEKNAKKKAAKEKKKKTQNQKKSKQKAEKAKKNKAKKEANAKKKAAKKRKNQAKKQAKAKKKKAPKQKKSKKKK